MYLESERVRERKREIESRNFDSQNDRIELTEFTNIISLRALGVY